MTICGSVEMQYYSLNQYLKDTFGEKVYKIAIDGGFTCPNRDGSIDTRGCIFCSGMGSGDFAESRMNTITEQIENGKQRLLNKISNGKYVAYFQAFTNTYAPVEELRSKYMEAVRHPDIVAISIATRPDCLPNEVIALLQEMNAIKPVWVELGLQTIHETSAKYIRRGYSLDVYDTAVESLKQRNIEVVTHVIAGLPFETKEDFLSTISYVGNAGSDGIKLQLLHVLKGTDLAHEYENGVFDVLTKEEYLEWLQEALALLPKDIVIHRLTGDGPKDLLIAPTWSSRKREVLNDLHKKLKENQVYQGKQFD